MISKCIIVPLYKELINEYEKISLLQCFNIFNKQKIIFITFKSLNLKNYEAIINKRSFDITYFEKEYFTSIKNYNILMTSKLFYERFSSYTYALIYQLDAYVFTDQLDSWCNKNIDYIGAPWFEGYKKATLNSKLIGVGNGGFSLRNIQQTLNLISKNISFVSLFKIILKRNQKVSVKLLQFPKIIFYWILKKNITVIFNCNEDEYFGVFSKIIYPKYCVADVNTAISFSFEMCPEKLYDLNNMKLPFGCHAWELNLNFWRNKIKGL